jgi:Berberine and berberine like/Epidermal growth factor receptor transmembrane-juxtamembrane segment
MQWLRDAAFQVAPYVDGAYVNYIDRELTNWGQAYYAENYPRLLEIKRAVDPENFFQFAQSIGSPQEPAGTNHHWTRWAIIGGIVAVVAIATLAFVYSRRRRQSTAYGHVLDDNDERDFYTPLNAVQ